MHLVLSAFTAALLAPWMGWATAPHIQPPARLCGFPDAPALLSHPNGAPSAERSDFRPISNVREGASTVLVVRASFPDSPFQDDTAAMGRVHQEVRTYFREQSRGLFSFEFRIHPDTLLAPRARDYYSEKNFPELSVWLRETLAQRGVVLGRDFTFMVASFPRFSVGWAGFSSSNRTINLINGEYTSDVVGHELGHSLGLNHARAILKGKDGLFGKPDMSQVLEYGNPHDVMGSAHLPAGHFSIHMKRDLGWTGQEEVIEVERNGVYRLYGHDASLRNRPGRLLGIRVPVRDATRQGYWFEFRGIGAAHQGPLVTFEGQWGSSIDAPASTYSRNFYLLDVNGGGGLGYPLRMGSEFRDRHGRMTFRNVGFKHADDPQDSWVDVEVTLPDIPILALPRKAPLPDGPWEASEIRDLLGRLRTPEGGFLGPSGRRPGTILLAR